MSETKILKNLIEKAYEDRTVDGLHFEDVYDQGYVDGLEWALQKITDSEPTLNENQHIVLEWLKKHSNHPFDAVQIINTKQAQPEVNRVIYKLSKIEQSQILQAFASWVLEQEEE